MLCTIADIPLLPDRFLWTSSSSSQSFQNERLSLVKKLLAVSFHISGETERVVACALFRKLGIALLERLDDGHVLGQGRGGAVCTPDRQLPIAANMQQDVVGHVDQHRRLGQRNQRLVKGDV